MLCCVHELLSWVDIFWTRGELGHLFLAKATSGDGDEGDGLTVLGTGTMWDLEMKLSKNGTLIET